MGLDVELQELADRVRAVDALAAERLEDLALATVPGGDAGAWCGMDVFRAIDPVGTVKPLLNAPLANERMASLERWRNALALAPLILTWLGLTVAATGYQAAIHADASLLNQPFLLLWQEGFLGHLPRLLAPLAVLTFSHVALLDVALLAAMVLITWHIHGELNVAGSKRAAQAQELEAKLQHACWRAALALNERTSPLVVADHFREASDALLDELYAERARLGEIRDDRERELADLHSVASALQQGAGDLLRSGGEVRVTVDTLLRVSAALDDRLAELTRQQLQLESGITAAGKDIANAGLLQQAACSQLDGAARLLTDTADASVAATGALSDVLAQLRLEVAELRQQLLLLPAGGSWGSVSRSTTLAPTASGRPVNGEQGRI